MGKRIWIVNYYAQVPLLLSNSRYIQFARAFQDKGYDVITFNSSLASGTEDVQNASNNVFLEKDYEGLKFVHINASAYHGNGMRRMWSIVRFSMLLKKEANRFPKPDVILHNIHPPFDYPIVSMAKKLGVKYIAEAWDLWPESFVRFGLIKENNPLMKVAHSIERRYYYNADEIIFTLLGAFDYLKQQGWTKDVGGKIGTGCLHYINNGIDLAQFDRDVKAYPRNDDDLNNQKIKKIIYLGAINRANNVKTLIEAASLMKDLRDYRFFIFGDGADRADLIQYVKAKQIDNVVFKEKRVSFAECAWIVSQATVNIMNYKKGFGKWGASSGKMFQYLAAGKPIVCNRDIAYDNVIKDNKLGVSKEIDSPEEFVEAIRSVAEQSQDDYDAMCNRVRKLAYQFDYKKLAQDELEVIESTLRK